MKKNKATESVLLRHYPALLSVATLVVAVVVMVSAESDYLQRVEEFDLFLSTPVFFHDKMLTAGGLLGYVSTFLTQFLHYPLVGSVLFAALCGLLMWLAWHTFRLDRRWVPLLVAIPALVLLTNFELGYWICFLKLRGHFFMAVTGFIVAVFQTWLFRRLAVRPWLCPLLTLAVSVVTYPLAGFYGLFAVVLATAVCWRMAVPLAVRIATTAVAVLTIVAVPLLCYRYVYCQTAIDGIWWTSLPVFAIGSQSFPNYYIPYVLLCLLLVAMALIGGRTEGQAVRRPRLLAAAHVAAIAAIAYGCWHFWYKDDNFHTELRMNAAIERCDWEGVVDLARQAEKPSRMMVLNRYLALFKLGRAGNEMYNLRDGDEPANAPYRVPLVEYGGKALYMHYGQLNFCHRWCMEDGVEKGFRIEELKYLLRCAVTNGEREVAKKYIDLLRHTMFYGDWAAHYEPLLTDTTALKNDPELGPITHVVSPQSRVASDKSVIETFLIELLSHSTTSDPVCADMILMHALQSKDIKTFWRAFFQYANLHVGQPMPRHYQEAALLYGNLEHNIDISHMPFDNQVKATYQQFMQRAQQNNNMSQEQLARVLYPQFGNTFFYNYFLRRGVKTY